MAGHALSVGLKAKDYRDETFCLHTNQTTLNRPFAGSNRSDAEVRTVMSQPELYEIKDKKMKCFRGIKSIMGSGIGVLITVALVLAAAYFLLFFPRPTYPPLILIDETYYIAGETSMETVPEDAQYLGKIEKTVPQTKAPSHNLEANHAVSGTEVHLLGNGDIIVGSGENWQRYYRHTD